MSLRTRLSRKQYEREEQAKQEAEQQEIQRKADILARQNEAVLRKIKKVEQELVLKIQDHRIPEAERGVLESDPALQAQAWRAAYLDFLEYHCDRLNIPRPTKQETDLMFDYMEINALDPAIFLSWVRAFENLKSEELIQPPPPPPRKRTLAERLGIDEAWFAKNKQPLLRLMEQKGFQLNVDDFAAVFQEAFRQSQLFQQQQKQKYNRNLQLEDCFPFDLGNVQRDLVAKVAPAAIRGSRENEKRERMEMVRNLHLEFQPIFREAIRTLQESGVWPTDAQQEQIWETWKTFNKLPMTVRDVRKAAYILWGDEMRPTDEERRETEMERDSNILTQEQFKQKWGVPIYHGYNSETWAPRGGLGE